IVSRKENRLWRMPMPGVHAHWRRARSRPRMQPVIGTSERNRRGRYPRERITCLSRFKKQPAAIRTAMKSDFKIHSVQCNLPSGRHHFASLRRVLIKDRVGIVDVNIDAALAINLRHIFEAPVGTADWQMAHR